jgi:putative sterol carrier protein
VDPPGARAGRYSRRTMTHAFLSEEWMAAAKVIREQYADEIPEVTAVIRINQVITDVPFGDGEVRTYIDTSSGRLELELGELDEPDATITTDYETAKALFVEQDQTVAMQAFMGGKIRVQGDMMKMMALQVAVPENEFSERVAEEIKAITA